MMNPDQILELSLAGLRAALDARRVTATAVVAACLERIAADNTDGKALRAVIAVNPAATAAARAWDAAKAQGRAVPGALSGIPFLAKDNIDTAAMPTTGGSLALARSVPPEDATVIRRLLDGGAILLGKTNLSELAASYGRLGYSAVGGQTVNPFNPLHDAAGSSSGSAVAVAARFAPFALGTDTSGSIRAPASTTGTVGLRPTLGLTSRAGVIPLALSFDTVGAITRTVADQAIVLDAIRGPDPADPATAEVTHPPEPFAAGLGGDALRSVRLGVVTNFLGRSAEVDAALAAGRATLAAAGADLVEVRLPDRFEDLWSQVLEPIGTAEFRPQFDAYLSRLAPGQPRDMAGFLRLLDSLTAGGTERINPARYRGLREAFSARAATPGYIAILTRRMPALRAELAGLFRHDRLDALIFATMDRPASLIGGCDAVHPASAAADPYAAAYIAPATGFPELSVPLGIVRGNLPIGLSLLGLPGADAQLLRLGDAFERLCPAPRC
ncbi:amidase family protein [Frigidibacter sp. MR17.14]|uniref:amidase n=1 Tax=Frigidibacter sp. MR17.14 TaxID=3126509 RepID=UPI003012CE26